MNPVDWFVEPLTHDVVQRAMITALVAAIVCAVLSCWLVLIGWPLMGDAISHAILPGVVVSYLIGAPFAIGALIVAALTVTLIGVVRETSRLKEDAAIGVVFTTLFAFGLVLLSATSSPAELEEILAGDLFSVTTGDAVQVVILGTFALGLLVAKRRDFTLFAFDPVHAHAIGLRPRVLAALLLGVLAVTTVVALQAVGTVLAVALLIIPGATASLLTNRFERMLWLSPLIAAVCAIVGVYVSYHLSAASGAMIVLVQGAVFGLAYLFSPKQGVIRRLAQRRAAYASTET